MSALNKQCSSSANYHKAIIEAISEQKEVFSMPELIDTALKKDVFKALSEEEAKKIIIDDVDLILNYGQDLIMKFDPKSTPPNLQYIKGELTT